MRKKAAIILGVLTVAILLGVGGYFFSNNKIKHTELNKPKVHAHGYKNSRGEYIE